MAGLVVLIQNFHALAPGAQPHRRPIRSSGHSIPPPFHYRTDTNLESLIPGRVSYRISPVSCSTNVARMPHFVMRRINEMVSGALVLVRI